MLQPKQISKVLSQAFKPVSTEEGSSRMGPAPIALSLLYHNGLPLSSVINPDIEKYNLTADNLKIYSLLAVNYFKSEENSNWTVIELDENTRVMIQKLGPSIEGKAINDKEPVQDDSLYVVIFYDSTLQASIAKLKLDAVCKCLDEGLQGYTPL